MAGLSGSVLVFWHEIEAAGLPRAGDGQPSGTPRSLAALVRAAAARHPAADPWRVMPAAAPGEATRVVLLLPEGGRVTVYLHPRDGRVLGELAWGGAAIHVLYQLHSGALFGEWGEFAVGCVGLLLAALALAGILLWTYHDGRRVQESLVPLPSLRGLRRRRNLHRAVGAWAAVPLMLAGLTGSALVWPDTARAVLARLVGAPPAATARPGGDRAVDLDGAVAAAEAALPGHRTAWVDLPAEKGEPWEVALLRRDGAVEAPARATVAWNGEVEEASPPSPVEAARAWIMALHNGTAGGWAHRLFVVALGLTPAFLGVTGAMVWWRRRAPRRGV